MRARESAEVACVTVTSSSHYSSWALTRGLLPAIRLCESSLACDWSKVVPYFCSYRSFQFMITSTTWQV